MKEKKKILKQPVPEGTLIWSEWFDSLGIVLSSWKEHTHYRHRILCQGKTLSIITGEIIRRVGD